MKVYTEHQPWGQSYLLALVWWCGDDICDCSQAQIEQIFPNPVGRPWILRERVWQGPFYTHGEQGAEADLKRHLDELVASGDFELVAS